jgi:hypothetical protein
MQAGNTGGEKGLETDPGHVIARIRPLKDANCKGGHRTAVTLGNPKDFR